MIAIQSIDELKNHVDEEPYNEFFMRLNGGCRSTKTIQYFKDNDYWYILNHIDDSVSEYESTKDLIQSEPLIIKAMANNAFFKDKD
jgi:hypothetical protein